MISPSMIPVAQDFSPARGRRKAEALRYRDTMGIVLALLLMVAATRPAVLAAHGESLAAFDGRCILAGGVASPSNIPDILGRRALPARRLARLGATPDFHHGLLEAQPARAPYAGRPLTDALRDLQMQGLKIVFSSELVRPDLRVLAEPRAKSPRKVLDELLRPHGLEVRNGPAGTLLIVARARPAPAAKPAPAAAAAGRISGRVVDARNGNPIAGVTVEVQGSGHGTHTDEEGAFLLDGVPAGRQALFVSTIGYALARPVVDVPAASTVTVTVPLAEGTGAYTERVTVTAERPVDTVATTPVQQTLGSAGLQSVRAVLVDDPLRAVQALPGVAANDDFRSDFSVRGTGFGHVGLSIDGVATPWLLHDFAESENSGSLAILNSDILDHVTLSSGSYPQRYADRTGGWLDSTMREGSRSATAVRAAVSGTNASLLAEGPLGAGAGGSWLVSFRRSYIDWLMRRVVPDFSSAIFGFTDLEAKVVYDLTPRQQLQVTAVGGLSRLADEEDPDPSSVAHSANDLALSTVALRSTVDSSLVVTQRASVVGQRFRNLNPYSDENGTGHYRDFSYRADAVWTPRRDTILEAGAEYKQVQSARTLRQYAFGADRVTPVLLRTSTFDASASVPSAFAHVVFGAGHRITISPGARVAHSTLVNETVVSPWVQASVALGGRLSLRAGAGVYHQFPDFTQVYGPTAGSGLRSERARQFDVAIAHDLDPSTHWQVSFYRRDDDRFLRREQSEYRLVNGGIVLPSVDGPWRNALTGESSGVELMLQRTIGQGLSGWLSYAYGHTTYRDELTGETFDGDFDQRHTVNAWIQYALSSRTSVSTKLRIGSNFPMTGYWQEKNGVIFVGEQRNEIRVPTYARLDVRANRVFNYTKRRLTLFVEVMNVLDRDNVRAITPGLILSRRIVGGVPISGQAINYRQSLFPLMPSAGVLFEF
jgi:hypothetical protein